MKTWVIQCGEQRVHACLDVPALPSSETQRFMDTQAEARWASSSLSLGTEARSQVGRLSSYLAQLLAKKKKDGPTAQSVGHWNSVEKGEA